MQQSIDRGGDIFTVSTGHRDLFDTGRLEETVITHQEDVTIANDK